ncbi:hypothetical protein Pmar_PMAR020528 [Perkinsus marinus ATCC 50983]|uniref:Uncharacterized protein n=1 Tax=Perkinsus marinus (strain ATCC 50983 / TXsc) TaxID=423536 RepID=C5L7A1_PERM5|nr:hypothetical protein Pmar_PMAR020528 [Perkinsus marinus ATCC 50983]EER07363.1 hypothetical protein Pmar_PMAR020528 [Perkinsus marinus ATCC 50983]|eukprot:XP_002775547.1 hypothetical protein Pmar_PMAR020528 [Perkinsus marinus ATCC 50983]
MGGLGLTDLDRVLEIEEDEETGRYYHHHSTNRVKALPPIHQQVGDDALRGVPLSDVAARWLIFRGSKGTSSTYNLSHPVSHLDLFISHSWAANAFWKHLSLVTAYYIYIAYIALLILSISLSIMVYFLPSRREFVAFYVEIGGLMVVCFGVAFGYIFPRLFRKDQVVFLDKCCISQTDIELKNIGIHHISSFLSRSDGLVILWSTDYFSRLWCVFELASFLRTHEPGRVTFISIIQTKFSTLVALCEAAILVTMTSIDLSAVSKQIESFTPLILYLSLEAVVTIIISTIVCFIFVPAKANLQAQINNFTVASAQCTLQEDRAFIRESIAKWYGSEAQFEGNLRAHWAEIAATQMPIWTLSKRGVYIVVAPFIAYGIPGLAFSLSADGLHPVTEWWRPLRDMLILTIMLGCRTPLIANVAYKMYAMNTLHSRLSKVVLYTAIVAFGLAYDATLVVGGGAALFSNTTGYQINIPEPYGWIFVIPVVFVLVYLYIAYTRHTDVTPTAVAADSGRSFAQQYAPTTSSSV